MNKDKPTRSLDRSADPAGSNVTPDADDVAAILGLDDPRGAWRRRLAWLAVAGALIGLFAAIAWLTTARGPALQYVTEAVTRGHLLVVITATGSVQPLNKVDVSSEQSGTVRRVLVDFNSRVEPGQILAELDTEKLDAALRSADAHRLTAQAQVRLADATLAEAMQELLRKQELAERQISPVRELEAAIAAHRRAEATLAAAKAQLAVAEAETRLSRINLERAIIRSPIRGVVLRRAVDPGQTVAVTLQAPVLFVIAEDLTQMELQVDIDEADVGQVRVGQTARFSVDAYPERRFPARIRDVRYGSEVIQGVVTYKGVLTIDNSELLLRPGMTATAEIIAREVKDALLASNAALRFTPPAPEPERSWIRSVMPGIPNFRAPSKPEESGNERTLWLLRNGVPEAVPVVIGATDGRRTEIVQGTVQPGDPVIHEAVRR